MNEKSPSILRIVVYIDVDRYIEPLPVFITYIQNAVVQMPLKEQVILVTQESQNCSWMNIVR